MSLRLATLVLNLTATGQLQKLLKKEMYKMDACIPAQDVHTHRA